MYVPAHGFAKALNLGMFEQSLELLFRGQFHEQNGAYAMNRHEFTNILRNKVLILDGATGTELEKQGLPTDTCPEKWVSENTESILHVQNDYVAAGSNIVYSPTFGGNRKKLACYGLSNECQALNSQLVSLSKQANPNGFVFGDVSSTGSFVEPFGDLSFDAAIAIFTEQIQALLDGGADGIVIETMMDIQEARAALIAARQLTDKPVMVSMTFSDGATLTGSTPVSALITLQSLGADIVGCNCGVGPEQMIDTITQMKPFAKVPLLAKPNAGIPRLVDGNTVFDMPAEAFGLCAQKLIHAGANIIGGCCGSTPEHIRALATQCATILPLPPNPNQQSVLSSTQRIAVLGLNEPVGIIGERINPTGKKRLQKELKDQNIAYVKELALSQQQNGALILDVNMGMPGIDEADMMRKSVLALTPLTHLPLCIDTTDASVLEEALKLYPGRALVNSISLEKERIEKMLPIAAKYGAMIIALPLTDSGIPDTVAGRIQVLNQILSHAESYGYKKHDIIADALVMAISADQSAVLNTFEFISQCHDDLKLLTTCGLSNGSFGLPDRKQINSTLLSMAISRGLSLAIANPSSDSVVNSLISANALLGRDKNLKQYTTRFSNTVVDTVKSCTKNMDESPVDRVAHCIVQGLDDHISDAINQALDQGVSAKTLVDDYMIPAINTVGQKFENKEYYLPQLMMSATAMKKGFTIVKPLLKKKINGDKAQQQKTILLATVKGDIHDIGKNIVALMLENYNFNVIDLGKDVPALDIINAAKEHNADIIGLSALMTTTMTQMADVIDLANSDATITGKFIIGGAVVNQQYADEIGASGYAADAMEAVRLVQLLV